MVEKELTDIVRCDLRLAKKDPDHPKSIKIYLEIISNLTDRLAAAKYTNLCNCGKCLDCLRIERNTCSQ